jgi:hypothetical protein
MFTGRISAYAPPERQVNTRLCQIIVSAGPDIAEVNGGSRPWNSQMGAAASMGY